jgi:O-Antigen ligase
VRPILRRIRHLAGKHVITAAVAAGIVALAMAEGGYGPVAFAAGALVVWAAVLLGLATGILPRSEPPRPAIAAGACLLGLAALTALSLAWANDDGRAFEDVVRALGYLGLFALAVVAARRGDGGQWLRGLAIGLTAVAAIALGSRLEPSIFGDADLEIAASLPVAQGRLSYPIGYWNGLASMMAIAVVLLGWMGVAAASRARRSIAVAAIPLPVLAIYVSTSRGGLIAAAIGLVVLLIAGPARPRIVAGLAIAGAGSAVLIAVAATRDELLDRPGSELAASQGDELLLFVIGVVLLVGLARWLVDPPLVRIEVPPALARATIAAAAVLVVAAIVVADPVERYDDFKATPTAAEGSGSSERNLLARGGSSGRYQFWSAAVDAFESEPLHGVGAGGYEAWWNQNGSIAAPARNAHSLFFETLSELGPVGAGLVLAFFAIAIVTGIRRHRAAGTGTASSSSDAPRLIAAAALAVLVAGAIGAAGDWTWDLPAVFGPVVIAAAVLTGPATLAPRAGPDGPAAVFGTVRSRRRFAGGVAILLVGWASICASGLLLLAHNSLESSRSAAARGDIEGAVDAANDAIDLEPWAAEPRTQLGLVYEQGGDLDAAMAAMDEAIDRAPDDWRLRMVAGCLALADDDLAGARASAADARALNPRAPELAQPDDVLLRGFCGGEAAS